MTYGVSQKKLSHYYQTFVRIWSILPCDGKEPQSSINPALQEMLIIQKTVFRKSKPKQD